MREETTADPGHVSQELLDGYFLGRRSLAEVGRWVIAHLVEHCPECRRRVEEIDLEQAFRESTEDAEARLRAEHELLSDALTELLALGPAETLLRVASDPRFATLAFAQHQIEVASTAYTHGELEIASEASRLALLVARRLDPGRHGRTAIAWVEAESGFLRSRLETVEGRLVEARRWWASARRRAQAAGRPPSLKALGYLVGAEIRLAGGRVEPAHIFATAAAALAESAEIERWSWSIARMAARLERLRGRPGAAVTRLRARFEERAPESPLEWSVARELVFALLDGDELGEAVGWIASWSGALGADAPEMVVLLGGLARRRGRLDFARNLLEQGREELLIQRRGAEAVWATVELLRVLEIQGETTRQRTVAARLERLAECPDVPRRVLQVLARHGAALWRGRSGDLDTVEGAVLLHLGAPIDHRPHECS